MHAGKVPRSARDEVALPSPVRARDEVALPSPVRARDEVVLPFPRPPPPDTLPAMSAPPPIPGFRPVPFTGVIFVMAEAGRLGYRYGHPEWCNLGQGQPETGPLPGAPPRMHQIEIGVDDQDYAPVPGIWELRRAVAELYNRLYRSGKRSQYTERNVCICGGGRASLTRAVAALGQVNLGHFLPDYTAYEELLDIFKLFTSIPILLDGREGYHFSRRASAGGDHRPRPVGGAALQSLQPDRPGDRGPGAERLGHRGAGAELLAAGGRVLLALRLARHRRRRRSRLRGALRGRRRHRSRDPLRRADQELALSGMALQLDRGTAAGDRRGLEQRLVPRRGRQQAAAAVGGAAAGAHHRGSRDRRRSGTRSSASAS